MSLDSLNPPNDSGVDLSLESSRGEIHCRYHRPAGTPHGAVLLVGGTDGGLDGPADSIYAALAERLADDGIAGLRLDFRLHTAPGVLGEAIHDVFHGLDYLAKEGITRVGLVGHSFGGAVVIATALQRSEVAAVVTLSTQTAGVEGVQRLAPRPLLLVHGSADDRLPPACSEYVYAMAREPKELVIFKGARHSLRQCRGELLELLAQWLLRELMRQPSVQCSGPQHRLQPRDR